MILLPAILFVNVLLPALTAPDLSQARARVNEIKARVQATRERLRANSPRTSNHVRANRPKRQHYPAYPGPYAQPPPPPPPPPPTYQENYEDEPTLVHICSLEEGDDYARSAEDHEDHHFGMSRMNLDEKNKVESIRSDFPDFEKQRERSLDNALEELSEVRELLNKFEDESFRHAESASSQRPNSKFASNFPRQELWAPSLDEHNLEADKAKSQSFEQEIRDADAHHSFLHQHRLHRPILPTSVVSPGLQFSQTQVTPGVNLNINHNHGINSLHTTPQITQGLNSGFQTNGFLNRGIQSSFTGQGFVPSVNSVQSQSIISSQTQPFFNLRHDAQSLEKNAEAEAIRPLSGVHRNPQTGFPRGPITPSNRPISNNRFPGQNLNRPISNFPRFQAENPLMREDFSESSEENPKARTTEKLKLKILKKKLKKLPTYYIVYPPNDNSYSPYYRQSEDEELDDEETDESEVVDPEAEETENRDADPTHGKKRKHKSGHFREAEENDFEEMREANPTHNKLKHKKTKFVPVYVQPQHYGRYREAEDSFDDMVATSSEMREASPTHKLKHKKTKFVPVYVQPQHYGSYKEAENEDTFLEETETEREHKTSVQKPEESHEFQERENSLDDLVSSNYLFNFPQNNKYSDQYKRSLDESLDQLLAAQRQVVDSLNATTDNNEDMKFVTDIVNRTLSTVEEHRKKVSKRSIPLTRLITDPRVRLDVPKTIENVGIATKNSFEDERAPMYHLKQLLGSSKNAFLSAMRIPSQNMIIPSDYEIVKSSEVDSLPSRRNSMSEDDTFSRTFNTVGHMVRDSVRSGKETAVHLGDAAHSARNILNTARHSAPRLIIPYSQIPAIQDTRLKKPSKAILITPRIIDFTEEASGRKSLDSRPNFVKLGHLMDAVGISKPEPKNLDFHKIIFEPKGISEARVSKTFEHLYKRFRDGQDEDRAIKDALNTLQDAKLSVGARNLKDFLVQMRGELTDFVHPPKNKKKKIILGKKKQETKEMGKFIENLFDSSTMETKNEEVVGQGLFLPPELMRPFMGRPTEAELHTFLHDNGDEETDNTLEHTKNHETKKHGSQTNNSDLGYVLGAINPLMFERLYNQTVEVRNNDATNPEDLFRRQEPEANGTVGTSFSLTKPLMTPFMGQARPEQVSELLDTYNKGDSSDYEVTED